MRDAPRNPLEMPASQPTSASTVLERALWLILPGAPASVAVGWLGWMVAVGAAASVLAGRLGPAGTALAIVLPGWALARRGLVPPDCLRRYHLDDAELTVLGPGRRVRRVPWSEIAILTQERSALRLETAGVRLGLPLASLVRTAGWSALLTRVVAGIAADTWSQIEDGEPVALRPRLYPSTRALAWWLYAPALVAALCGAGPRTLALAVGFSLVERALGLVRRGATVMTLAREGITLRRWGRPSVLPWSEAEVARVPRGLFVGGPNGTCALVGSGLPNFCAVAPVIETKAHLGMYSARVSFRVRVTDGAPAVVGEIEPAA